MYVWILLSLSLCAFSYLHTVSLCFPYFHWNMQLFYVVLHFSYPTIMWSLFMVLTIHILCRTSVTAPLTEYFLSWGFDQAQIFIFMCMYLKQYTLIWQYLNLARLRVYKQLIVKLGPVRIILVVKVWAWTKSQENNISDSGSATIRRY